MAKKKFTVRFLKRIEEVPLGGRIEVDKQEYEVLYRSNIKPDITGRRALPTGTWVTELAEITEEDDEEVYPVESFQG